MSESGDLLTQCPLPMLGKEKIFLAHGGGGKLMHELIEKIFLPAFRNNLLDTRHDGAVFKIQNVRLAFSTDSYVVHPLFFPGGDIGSMAVYGTVNDLAMCGAKPLYLSVAFIIEEGFRTETLAKIAHHMGQAAKRCGVQLVTGDVKVVEKGKGDGLFVNTSGVGVLYHEQQIGPASVQAGDQIILNGDLGRHGMAVMAAREGLEFESDIESDSAPLAELVGVLLEQGLEIHCMRDLTRGGLASALNEISGAKGLNISVLEGALPVKENVRGACEILGLDPLYVANEGRFILFTPPRHVGRALSIMRSFGIGREAAIIGEVKTGSEGIVTLLSSIGTTRVLDMLSGEQLPRIC